MARYTTHCRLELHKHSTTPLFLGVTRMPFKVSPLFSLPRCCNWETSSPTLLAVINPHFKQQMSSVLWMKNHWQVFQKPYLSNTIGKKNGWHFHSQKHFPFQKKIPEFVKRKLIQICIYIYIRVSIYRDTLRLRDLFTI